VHGVASTAVVEPGAAIGDGVTIGHYSVVHGDVEIGEGSAIGDHVVLGAGDAASLSIGPGSTIRSHTVVYAGSDLGERFETGHHALVRAGARTGVNFRLGSYSSLEGEVVAGDYVRIHGYTQVGSGSVIGDFAWIYSLCTLTNDPLPPSSLFEPVVVGDAAVVCPSSTLMPGCRLGRGAFVAAGAIVSGDVPDGAVVATDGRVSGRVDRLMNLASGVRHPWLRHFTEGYPDDARARLETLRDEVLAACKDVTVDGA
jgi:UDP-3-O-[3-hydroxymyristoyl] glucosamine N-acyltransferase